MRRARLALNRVGIILTAMAIHVAVAEPQTGQEVLRRELDGLTVAVDKSPEHYTVRLIDAASSRQVILPSGADSILDARRWNNRAIVFGTLEQSSVVYVLSIDTATVIDTIVGAQLSASPDARFLAYRRADPRTDPDTALYLVYDMSMSPVLNRMTPSNDSPSYILSGTAVFPEWNHDSRSYEHNPSSGAFHELKSPIRWLDATTFAFLDYAAPTISCVLVSVRNGLDTPEVRERVLEAASIVDRRKLELAASEPLAQVISASDIVPIRSTPTTWVFELVIHDGPYVKLWTVDIEM